ncbi:MAG TPA: hypothetical protein GX505_08865 [Clostridiales bacterium]|nr:hypothetical protein [Clostridiales bacterium]
MEQEKRQSQFIYVLRPIPRLLKEENWTEQEEKIIDKHFAYLQNLLAEGKLILAGKTCGLDEKTFGVVIIEADSIEEAYQMMNNDPGVSDGIMTAELFTYNVAIMRQSNS